ncbi:MAG: hypothetical protein IPM86_03060 [Saprospiraceae bacterium]|nr:hypothetical protein [Saprospiraceae bacterium]
MNLRRVVILALLLFSQLNLFSQANYLVGNCKGSFMNISGSGSLLAGSQADDAALTFALPFQ